MQTKTIKMEIELYARDENGNQVDLDLSIGKKLVLQIVDLVKSVGGVEAKIRTDSIVEFKKESTSKKLWKKITNTG